MSNIVRPLVIDEEARQKVRAVETFAAQNHYRPNKSETVPGDDPRHTVELNTYRCVFSYTEMHGQLYRHLSISVPGAGYPNPIAVNAIADLFGFPGWDGISTTPPKSWMGHVNEQEHCVTVALEVPKN